MTPGSPLALEPLGGRCHLPKAKCPRVPGQDPHSRTQPGLLQAVTNSAHDPGPQAGQCPGRHPPLDRQNPFSCPGLAETAGISLTTATSVAATLPGGPGGEAGEQYFCQPFSQEWRLRPGGHVPL